MADENIKVRVEECLKIKIGEAKQLHGRTNTSSQLRNVFCTIALDQEEIFRTSTVEKTLNPFFGEEFQFEVPRNFRFLSIYVLDRDRHMKQNSILGKVAIKREDLELYNHKDHWFALRPVDADSEVQGKVNIRIKEFERTPKGLDRRLVVEIAECLDLTLRNGGCDPYALVTVTYTNGRHVTKRTKVRKKTTCPQFEEVFVFESNEGKDKNNPFDDPDICDLNVSVWHLASRMSDDVFLGEIRLQLNGVQQQNAALKNAWYYLQPRSSKNRPTFSTSSPPGTRLSSNNSLGSLRLRIQYNQDKVLPAEDYESLKELLFSSINVDSITSSPLYVLGDTVSNKMEIAQPLVRIFLFHDKIVPVIRALADTEISILTDPTTVFRGNTLVSKMMDEAMRLIGLQYLQKTLQPTLKLIFAERKPCEIDPAKVNDPNTIKTNQANLILYVQKIFKAITESAIYCPPLMCQIFNNLKECAMRCFPDNREIRYSVISGFIFLRFFAPAILGPRLFDLTTQQIDPQTNRTLTLISKTIQSLGNLVSCRSTQQIYKEDYMECLYKEFYTEERLKAVRKFLEIISDSSHPQPIDNNIPIILKEGLMIKRGQHRSRFGRKNFKERYFELTTHALSYYKNKDKCKEPLCKIPLTDILAVERLEEKSFKRKNMFQIVQPTRKLYVQALNCVEEREWIDLLTKVCRANRNKSGKYHPAAYVHDKWLCCNSANEFSEGCMGTSYIDSNNFSMTLDPVRDLQRIYSLIMCHKDALRKRTSNNEVVFHIANVATEIEQKHRTYLRNLTRDTKYGSLATPIGDNNYLLASKMNFKCLRD